MRKSYPEPD